MNDYVSTVLEKVEFCFLTSHQSYYFAGLLVNIITQLSWKISKSNSERERSYYLTQLGLVKTVQQFAKKNDFSDEACDKFISYFGKQLLFFDKFQDLTTNVVRAEIPDQQQPKPQGVPKVFWSFGDPF